MDKGREGGQGVDKGRQVGREGGQGEGRQDSGQGEGGWIWWCRGGQGKGDKGRVLASVTYHSR